MAEVIGLNTLARNRLGRFERERELFPEAIGALALLTKQIDWLLQVCNQAAEINLLPYDCYIDPADQSLRNAREATGLWELTKWAEEKVRLAERQV